VKAAFDSPVVSARGLELHAHFIIILFFEGDIGTVKPGGFKNESKATGLGTPVKAFDLPSYFANNSHQIIFREFFLKIILSLLKIPRGGSMFAEDYLFEKSFFVVQSEFFEIDNCYDSVEN
jgi:adenine-specific DNA methylase